MKLNSILILGLAFTLLTNTFAQQALARSLAEAKLPTVLPKKAVIAEAQTQTPDANAAAAVIPTAAPSENVAVVTASAQTATTETKAAPSETKPALVAPAPAVRPAEPAPIAPEIVEPHVIAGEPVTSDYAIQVKEIDTESKTAVLGVTGHAGLVIAGSKLILKNGDSQLCKVFVLETRGEFARADLSGCPLGQVKVGQTLERSLFEQFAQAPAAPAVVGGDDSKYDTAVQVTKLKMAAPQAASFSRQQPEERPVRLSLALYLTTADTFHFNDARYFTTTSQGDFNGEFGSEGAGGLNISVGTTRKYGWGGAVGVSFDGKRELESFTRKEAGMTTTESFSGVKPALSLATVDFNANLRANRGFLFAGLNYSFPHYHAVSGAPGSVRTGGGIGSQIGIGSHLSDGFAIELMARMVRFSMAVDSPALSWETGMISLGGLQLQTRFTF